MKQIAILGPGTVGGGVAEILMKNADTVAASAGEEIGLKYAVARREMPDCPCADKIVQDFDVVERDPEVWLVVETIGGCGAALDMVRRSLQAGKHVVTANKQLIAEHGVELFQLARENRVNLLFEASVGGGIPVLNPMTRCLGANHITAVSGILNGTTNYILTQMLENGESYDAALRAAQEKGYAEADPTADVKGIDAVRKTCILAGLAFGKNVDPADHPRRGHHEGDGGGCGVRGGGRHEDQAAGPRDAAGREALLLCQPALCARREDPCGSRRRRQCGRRGGRHGRRSDVLRARRGPVSDGERRRG